MNRVEVKDLAPSELPIRISRVPKTEAERKTLRTAVHRLCRRIRPMKRRQQVEEETYNAILADAQATFREPTPGASLLLPGQPRPSGHLILPPQQQVKPLTAAKPTGWRDAGGGLVVPTK